MSPNQPGMRVGSNTETVTTGQVVTLTQAGALIAGIPINDVAIDSTNGDAYFSDSPNCR